MRSQSFVFFLLFVASFSAKAQQFDFNNRCKTTYQQLMALDNAAAQKLLETEIAENPKNLIPLYLADYSNCLSILFNGSETEFDLLKNKQEILLEKIETGDTKSPWFRFCKANVHLHAAIVRLRFGDNFGAATRFRKSFLLLKENLQKHPNFEENKVLYGLEMAIAGAIPENYQWLSSLMGIKGNIKNGVAFLANYIDKHPDGNAPMQEEALIYYAYLKFYLQNEQQVAWRFLNSNLFEEKQNLMRSFIKANIALNYRKAATAEQILLLAKKEMPTFEQFPILEYELAEAMLMKLDMNCVNHFQAFIKNDKGNHFIKDAWLKLAIVAHLQGNTIERNRCIAQIKTNGNASTDADKQAARFAEKPNWTLPALLKVRLLIDGGYYDNALSIMRSIDKKNLETLSSKLEYNFRYGRLFEELGKSENALIFYDATIKMGRSEKDYFAARAALQKGFIYEKRGEKTLAIAQYKDCLTMRHHDMQSSIDQQAKAGLNRLGE